MGTRGRPREFDRDAALRKALELFWSRGYTATSLDELTSAMGIGRSSFYAAFVSKHRVLLEVLTLYTGELLAEMDVAAAAAASPHAAIREILEIVACTREPINGCLFFNSVTELLPADGAVAALARRHLGKVDARVVHCLHRIGLTGAEARRRSGALLALATGAIVLRKAGQSTKQVRSMLDLAQELLP